MSSCGCCKKGPCKTINFVVFVQTGDYIPPPKDLYISPDPCAYFDYQYSISSVGFNYQHVPLNPVLSFTSDCLKNLNIPHLSTDDILYDFGKDCEYLAPIVSNLKIKINNSLQIDDDYTYIYRTKQNYKSYKPKCTFGSGKDVYNYIRTSAYNSSDHTINPADGKTILTNPAFYDNKIYTNIGSIGSIGLTGTENIQADIQFYDNNINTYVTMPIATYWRLQFSCNFSPLKFGVYKANYIIKDSFTAYLKDFISLPENKDKTSFIYPIYININSAKPTYPISVQGQTKYEFNVSNVAKQPASVGQDIKNSQAGNIASDAISRYTAEASVNYNGSDKYGPILGSNPTQINCSITNSDETIVQNTQSISLPPPSIVNYTYKVEITNNITHQKRTVSYPIAPVGNSATIFPSALERNLSTSIFAEVYCKDGDGLELSSAINTDACGNISNIIVTQKPESNPVQYKAEIPYICNNIRSYVLNPTTTIANMSVPVYYDNPIYWPTLRPVSNQKSQSNTSGLVYYELYSVNQQGSPFLPLYTCDIDFFESNLYSYNPKENFPPASFLVGASTVFLLPIVTVNQDEEVTFAYYVNNETGKSQLIPPDFEDTCAVVYAPIVHVQTS
jgi:hypothetical protein